MELNLSRRNFLATAGTAAMAVTAGAGLAAESSGADKRLKILSIACSPRKGMTTSKAVQAALDAAKSVDARIEVELIDLGGLNIAGYLEQIQAAMLCFGMIPVGGHAPAFQGATLLSANDSISQDELGLKTATQLGKHVGEAAIKLPKSL